MAQKGTFEFVIIELARLMQPLADAAEDGADGIRRLGTEFKLDLDFIIKQSSISNLSNIASAIKETFGPLRQISETGQVDEANALQVLNDVPKLFDAIQKMDQLELKDDVPAEFQPIGRILLDSLIIRYLVDFHPGAYSCLLLVGVIDEGEKKGSVHPKIRYSYLTKLITSPTEVASDVYGWGSDDFDASLLLVRLQSFFWSLSLPANFNHVPSDQTLPHTDANVSLPLPLLRVPLLQVDRENNDEEFGVSIIPVGPKDGHKPGLGVIPFGIAKVSEDIHLDDGWSLKISASADALVPWGITIRPNAVELSEVGNANCPQTVNLHFAVLRAPLKDERSILFGSAEGPRLELGTVNLQGGLELNGEPEIFVELPIKGLRAVIKATEGDGFLRKVLPPEGIQADFDLTVGFSSRKGIYLLGSEGLEVSIPTHVSLGPMDLQAMTLGAKIGEKSLMLSLGATASVDLNVLQIVVEGVGINVMVEFPDGLGGNIGPANIDLGFKPPNAVGLSLNVPAVGGGGYLYVDSANGQYAGILQLEVADTISIKVVGLISTRLPDGTPCFSLLGIITTEFTPVQLGFGFSLNGVGGLFGAHRTMVVEALRAGIRQRTLGSILFPEDPVNNAQKIIGDVKTIFPPAEGRYVFGPMVKLAWGESIITAELGIILELPAPVRATVLGRLQAALPTEEAALVLLRLDALGIIDLGLREASIDATLYDSHIAQYQVSGDMAMRLNWGDHPSFALSVGGFYPGFAPPPKFPDLRRLTISLDAADYLRIALETYFALTSNSLQFGARVSLHAQADTWFGLLALDAWLGFDVLIKWPPFWMEAQIGGGVTIKLDGDPLIGAELEATLNGPGPWHAWGTATVHFLGTHSVDFDWQSDDNVAQLPPPAGDPWDALRTELMAPHNWSAQYTDNGHSIVSLRQVEAAADKVLVHPFGELSFRQRQVPLNVQITRFGSVPLPAPTTLGIEKIEMGGQDAQHASEPLRDLFAPGQFFELSDDEKISKPAFDPLASGYANISVSDDGSTGDPRCNKDRAVLLSFDYETIVFDAPPEPEDAADETKPEPVVVPDEKKYIASPEFVNRSTTMSAAGRAVLRQSGTDRFANPAAQTKVHVEYAQYVVVKLSEIDEASLKDVKPSYVEAEEVRTAKRHPEEWQVIGAHEMPEAVKP